MTRNDAIALVTNCTISSYDYQNLKHAVDRIYDDFTEQICSNCAFYSVEYIGVKTTANIIEEIETHNCDLNCASDYMTGEVIPEFGCNRFIELCK